MTVLITAGGTEEPLDGVRYITNFSTGRTGAFLAQYFFDRKAEVHYVHGRHALCPESSVIMHPFTTFQDLDRQMKTVIEELPHLDAVIHLAAVSDFSPEKMETSGGRMIPAGEEGKLSSEETFVIHMKKNYKIIDRIKGYAEPGSVLLVGFKLTNSSDSDLITRSIQTILARGSVDYLVQNNLTEISEHQHLSSLYDSEGHSLKSMTTKSELAESLYSLIADLNTPGFIHPHQNS